MKRFKNALNVHNFSNLCRGAYFYIFYHCHDVSVSLPAGGEEQSRWARGSRAAHQCGLEHDAKNHHLVSSKYHFYMFFYRFLMVFIVIHRFSDGFYRFIIGFHLFLMVLYRFLMVFCYLLAVFCNFLLVF